jgi:putative tryptophan/tyrosine transport system substrate-binding protein
MQRRTLILAGASLAAVAGCGKSEQKTVRIGIVAGDLVAPHEEEALIAGLREQGLVEGRNLVIERRYANGRLDTVLASAQELASLKLDAVISTCTPTTLVAQKVFGTTPASTPIVMAAVADPVGQKIIASLARPGANVTGLASQATDVVPKKLGLFAALLPPKPAIAVLMDASSNVHPPMWRITEEAAKPLGIRLLQVQAGRKPGQPSLSAAFDLAVSRQANGIFVLSDEPFFFTSRVEIVELAARHRLPAFYGLREFVDAGGLMSYGESMRAAFKGVAGYVAKIAAGDKPDAMPVAQPTVFELVINQKTAKALGITVPQDVLLSANSVIE